MKIQEKHIPIFTLIFPVVGITVATIMIIYLFSQEAKGHFQKDLDQNIEHILQNKKDRIQIEVDAIAEYIRYYKSLAPTDTKQLQKEILARITAKGQGKDDYFFVIDYDKNLLVHNDSSLLGKTLDKKRIVLFENMIQIAKQRGGGFLQYPWEKPSTKKIEDKISYVVGIQEWGWVVGTGVYLDDLSAKIAQEKQRHSTLISSYQEKFITAGCIIILLSIGFSLLVSRSIKSSIMSHKMEVEEKEQELTTLNRDLEKRVEEELEKNREKDKLLLEQSKLTIMGEMLGMIAHQWRQPLNSIGLIVQNIQEAYAFNELTKEDLDSDVEKTLESIQEMSKTIDTFYKFFKPTNQKNRVDPYQFLQKVEKSVKKRLEAQNISLLATCKQTEAVLVFESELMQSITNIINNAIEQFANTTVSNKIITIDAFNKHHHFIIEISDNAGGIQENLLDKVFDPYFSTKSKNGTGLGLYMAKMVIEVHMEGKLLVRNSNDGAVFTLSIPWIQENDIP